MKKIVVNRCFGGYGISHEAIMLYASKKGMTLYTYYTKTGNRDEMFKYDGETTPFILHYYTIDFGDSFNVKNNTERVNHYFGDDDIGRDDPVLIEVVEELGELANGIHADLEIVEIPDDVNRQIEEYDGTEWISEIHRTR